MRQHGPGKLATLTRFCSYLHYLHAILCYILSTYSFYALWWSRKNWNRTSPSPLMDVFFMNLALRLCNSKSCKRWVFGYDNYEAKSGQMPNASSNTDYLPRVLLEGQMLRATRTSYRVKGQMYSLDLPLTTS